MARKDCTAFGLACNNCGIRGHFEKVCCQPKQPKQSSSSPSATLNATTPCSPPATDSYFFVIQTSPTSQRSERRRLHCQQQQRQQRKRAQEDGIAPNHARIARRQQRRVHEIFQKERAESRAAEQAFAKSLHHATTKPHHHSKAAPMRSVPIPHMEWNGQDFQAQAPAPPPKTMVSVSIMHHAHKMFGRQWRNKPQVTPPTMLSAFTDTCAQTCTSGPGILQELQCPDAYLVPTSHGIHGITEKPLNILGALSLHIEAGGHHTCQVVYVAENIDGFYLSKTAMMDLQIINQTFPCNNSSQSASTSQTTAEAPCGCPLRADPPVHPEQIPFPPLPENQDKLENWILSHYTASAFNTCPHQALHTMSGRPMSISFRPDATPSAVHCPIPVPHHWKKSVKADLDQDVALGIIEPVPQGTPTIWCSHMVVTPKKDGAPRRTIDLQKLNQATLCETHHTPRLSIRSPLSLQTPRKLSSMHGMATTACHYHLTLEMPSHSSLNGGDTDTCGLPWGSKLPVTPTPNASMTSRSTVQGRHASSTTISYGIST